MQRSYAFNHTMDKQSASPPQDFDWQRLAEQEFCQAFKEENGAADAEEGPQPGLPALPQPDGPASPDHPYETEKGFKRKFPLRDWERALGFSSSDDDDDDDDDDEIDAEFFSNSSDSEPHCVRGRPERWVPKTEVTSTPPPLISASPDLVILEVVTEPTPGPSFASPATPTRAGPSWQPTTARMSNSVIIEHQQVRIKQQAEEISQARQELERLQRAIASEEKKKRRATEQRRCAAGVIACYDEWRRRCRLTDAKKRKERAAERELRNVVLALFESLRRDAD